MVVANVPVADHMYVKSHAKGAYNAATTRTIVQVAASQHVSMQGATKVTLTYTIHSIPSSLQDHVLLIMIEEGNDQSNWSLSTNGFKTENAAVSGSLDVPGIGAAWVRVLFAVDRITSPDSDVQDNKEFVVSAKLSTASA